MKHLTRILAALSMLLLSAHALRAGETGICAFFLGLAVLAFSGQAFARPVLAVALACGAYIWTDGAVDMVHIRLLFNQPWLRLVLILAAVAGTCFYALLLVSGRHGAAAFPKRPEDAGTRAAAFILTASLLWIASVRAPMPLLLLDRYLPGWGGLEILGLSFYAAWIVGKMCHRSKSAAVRGRYWAFFSAVFFLQLILGLCGMDKMLMTGQLHLPVPALIVGGPLYRGGGYFMPILFGCALLLVGPGWCGHLCYIGAWDDRLSRLVGKTRNPLPHWARHGRLATLILTVAAALGLRFAGITTLAAVMLAAAFGLVGVGVMAIVSRKAGIMAHCTAYCPMGLVANALGKIAPWRIRIGEGCDRCGRCAGNCRYGALSPYDIEAGKPGLTCTLCGDCLGACKGSRIGYRFPGLDPGTARQAYLALAVSLHAVFLGVARI